MSYKKGSIFGGALLVAGTATGGGMLALPVLTAQGGFFPALLIYLVCCAFMIATGILLVDVFLWSPKEVNLISMANMTLGRFGKAAAWVLYLFLFVSLTVAYLSGGGELLVSLFHLPAWLGPIAFALLFTPVVWVGPWVVDKINVVFMAGLILSFLAFVSIGFSHVQPVRLVDHHWPSALFATPVVFTAFGYQSLVPTLTDYLGRNRRAVYAAIVAGLAVPLVIYIIWEGLILGLVSAEDLKAARVMGCTAVAPLKTALGISWVYGIGQAFAFFAIVTSFWGVSLAGLDFLADGLRVKKTGWNRLGLLLLIIVPPLVFSTANPCLFLHALHYAGGIGSALLFGFLPIMMIWIGKRSFPSKIPNWFLLILVLFVVLELGLMLVKLIF
ncbi:MAG: tyrosine transporter [Verrucomicrobia bacterium]|nr:tyrosine transporter [Verrucomicrobiota bacterium]MBS0646048.1 tyrosine transporter [Verrucomicrobiota bacterium]